MNPQLYPQLTQLYENFMLTDDYAARQRQFAIVGINKEIIEETLKNGTLTNLHLTGLIQMFKFGCSDETFDKYLAVNVPNDERREAIAEETTAAAQWGYTGAGLNAVTQPDTNQLTTIQRFLRQAFTIQSIPDAITLCTQFDAQDIPQVKSGIYSPWLYYINPRLFPILNNSHREFREWIAIPPDYPSCIRDFNELKTLVAADELGGLDKFAHEFAKYSAHQGDTKVLDLAGKRLYKISHGVFRKKAEYRDTGIVELLEEKKWISLYENTGKNQGENFRETADVGDYVYICYGGDILYCIGRITSDAEPLDEETDKLIDGGQEWLYRTYEPLYYPTNASIRELKNRNRFFMPSGNSTFYEVPKDELDYINKAIFIPKFGVQVIDHIIGQTVRVDSEPLPPPKLFPMNTILYGPPGTGKTYHSINYAVAIIENKEVNDICKEPREIVKTRFEQYCADGRIKFCTFHQSIGYEDFIEGIKPIEPLTEDDSLTYAVEDGLFKRLCTEASFSFTRTTTPTDQTESAFDFSSVYDLFIDSINERFSKGEKVELQTRSGGTVAVERITEKDNIVIRHEEGNRVYTISKKRLSKLAQAFPDLSELTNISDQFRAEIGGANSSAYWAVLNAIRKESVNSLTTKGRPASSRQYSYDDKKDIVQSMQLDDYARDNDKKYVLIIDEINRGNISQIFGELITLLEDDKRLGKSEALKTILPYSKDEFGVPSNLHIIGTMNTADRSVEALDTALRRRFSFIAKPPIPGELKPTDDGIDLGKLLMVLNMRLTILKDHDHTIGHAWLWNTTTVDDVKNAFRDKILPLLQEYFYNDYEKLGLVLGDAFFEPHIQVSSRVFAPFGGGGSGLAAQYNQSWQYRLRDIDALSIADFKSLEILNQESTLDEE